MSRSLGAIAVAIVSPGPRHRRYDIVSVVCGALIDSGEEIPVGRRMRMRMALGAQRSAVIRLIVGAGLKLALFGIVATVLAAIAALACCVPALRATRIDPATSLRSE